MDWHEMIRHYEPWNEQEEKDKHIFLQCIDIFEDVLTRNNEIVHVTSSAFVVNKTRDKVLMVHHNIYNSWSWTGGHVDGESDFLKVAIQEVKEETGVTQVHPISQSMISLDVLSVIGHYKRGKYVAPHLHLSVAYLLEADENEVLVVKPDENSNVQWIPFKEVEIYSKEPHMIKVYNKIMFKTQKLKL